MTRHTPTPEIIYISVSKAFHHEYGTTPEGIRSKSRKVGNVVPREVCVYLMQTRGLMKVTEIAIELNTIERWVKRSIKNTRDRARVDLEFAQRIWLAELAILQSSK